MENQIPKTETVYEIKEEYKIPSFEDFMKNYENDGSLNYDDLGGGSVGEVKGYGPCRYKNSNCSCSCPRADYPRCNCNYDEGWVRTRMSCPAAGCGNQMVTSWVHSTDNYYTWISDQARIRCEKTDCPATDHMKDWAFKCSNHDFHKGKHVGGSYTSCREAIRIALESEDCEQVMFKLYKYVKRNSW